MCKRTGISKAKKRYWNLSLGYLCGFASIISITSCFLLYRESKVLHDRVEIPLKNYDFSGRLPLLGSGAKRFVPNTIEELQKFVKKCSQEGTRIRVVGGANSYSPIIQSAENGALVSLFNIDHLISVDKGKKQVTVEAGIRERDLHDIISEFGWSLPQVTRKFNILAGGLNSGHHSSGYDIPEVASAIVVGMKIVDGSGDLIVAEPGDDLFYAALVGLGRLGIVVEYTLQCTDKFYLKAVGVRKKTETLLSTMVDEAPHKKFWRLIFFPYTAYGYDLSLNSHFNDNELIFEKRQDNWASKYDFLYDFTSEWLSFHGYLTSLFRTLVRPLNKLQVAVIGDRVEMTGRRSDWMLAAGTGASEPPHDSYEIAFPLEKCEDAVRMIMDGLEARTISYPWCEVRVSGPSPAWLSPAYGKRICWYELPTYHQDDETHQYIIDLMQKAAEKYDGRPHWGKLNVYACSRSFLQEQYARFNDFTKMVQKMDPKGTFSSPWFDKIFNIDPDEPATQEISIIPLMDQVFASHHHSALLVFTRLNLFSFISDSNGVTVEILADHAKWTQRATSAMIISLTTSGILKESTQTCGTSTFYLSPLGERFLLQKNAGHMNDFLDLFWDHSPKTLLEKASIGTEKENFMLKTGGGAPSEFFINAMQGQTSFAAKVLAPLIRLEPTTRVVDVGGGSGTFVIEICKNNPSATGIIYELPDVVPIAEKYVKQANITNQVEVVSGNMFEDNLFALGDCYAFGNVLHDWPDEINKKLLQKAYESLPVDGCVIILEMLIHEDIASSTKSAAGLNLVMVTNEQGRQYKGRELEQMLKQTGFVDSEIISSTLTPYSIIRAFKEGGNRHS